MGRRSKDQDTLKMQAPEQSKMAEIDEEYRRRQDEEQAFWRAFRAKEVALEVAKASMPVGCSNDEFLERVRAVENFLNNTDAVSLPKEDYIAWRSNIDQQAQRITELEIELAHTRAYWLSVGAGRIDDALRDARHRHGLDATNTVTVAQVLSVLNAAVRDVHVDAEKLRTQVG